MMIHPDLLLAAAREHRRDLVAEADRQHSVMSALSARRHRRATSAGRRQADATLTPCGPHVAAPAR